MPSKEPSLFQRGLRSFARIVVVLLVLFVVFLVLIPFVGLDQLRQPIASALSQSTGLNIELESLNLEWTEGLGLRCGGLRVRSQDGSRNLFSADKMFLLAELRPLLSKQFKIKRAIIVRPLIHIYLERESEEKPPVVRKKQTLPGAKSQMPIPDTPQIRAAKNFFQRADFTLQKFEVEEGRIVLIQKTTDSTPEKEIPLNFSVAVQLERPSADRVDAVAEDFDLEFQDFNFKGTLRAEDILSETSEVKLELESDSFSFTDLLRLQTLLPEAVQEFLKQQPEAKFERLSLRVKTPLNSIQNPDTLKQYAFAELDFIVKDILVNSGGFSIAVPQIHGQGLWEKDRFAHKVTGHILDGEFRAEGTLNTKPPFRQNRPPNLSSNIYWEKLNLGLLKPKEGSGLIPVAGRTSGNLSLKGPLPKAGSDLIDNMRLKGIVNAQNVVLRIPGKTKPLTLSLKRLDGEGTWEKNRLVHKVRGTLLDGNFQIRGALDISRATEGDRTTLIDSDISLRQVNLMRLTKHNQGEWIPTSGTVSGSVHLKGLLPTEGQGALGENLNWSGNFFASNLVLGPAKKLQKIGQASIRFKEGSSQLTTAQIQLNRIQIQNLFFKKAWGIVRATPKAITLTGGRLWPLNGLIKMEGSYNPAPQTYRMKIRGDQLRAEDFLNQSLEGPGQFTAVFQGNLKTLEEAKKSGQKTGFPHFARGLSGNVGIKLTSGSIPKLGALETLLNLLNPANIINSNKKGLVYDRLGGDFKIRQGLLTTQNLEMDGPQLQLFTTGKADLYSGRLDAEGKAVPLQLLGELVDAIPLLGEIFNQGQKGGPLETYFEIKGTLQKPEFSLLPNKSIQEKPKQILKGLKNLSDQLTP